MVLVVVVHIRDTQELHVLVCVVGISLAPMVGSWALRPVAVWAKTGSAVAAFSLSKGIVVLSKEVTVTSVFFRLHTTVSKLHSSLESIGVKIVAVLDRLGPLPFTFLLLDHEVTVSEVPQCDHATARLCKVRYHIQVRVQEHAIIPCW